jgi:hypothetical protein
MQLLFFREVQLNTRKMIILKTSYQHQFSNAYQKFFSILSKFHLILKSTFFMLFLYENISEKLVYGQMHELLVNPRILGHFTLGIVISHYSFGLFICK